MEIVALQSKLTNRIRLLGLRAVTFSDERILRTLLDAFARGAIIEIRHRDGRIARIDIPTGAFNRTEGDAG